MPRTTLCLLALTLATPAQEVLPDPGTLIYISSMGGQKICRESVTLSPNGGWSTQGHLDLFGTQVSDFRASLARKQDGSMAYEVWSKSLKKEGDEGTTVRATIDSKGTLTASLLGTDKKRSLDLSEKKQLLIYENLVWASMVDLGRMLAKAGVDDSLQPGPCATGVQAAAGRSFEIQLRKWERSRQVVKGKLRTLWFFEIRLPPNVDIVMVCTSRGLPLRFEVPTQRLVVSTEGFEAVRGPIRKTTSPVDSGPWRKKLSQPEHDVVIEKKLMVPMRDGVRLACDVYRPAGDGKHPTILVRTPYRRTAEGGLKGNWYGRRGYAVVVQDVRGRFDSEGEFFPLKNEERDGSDTLDWIAKQPWSTGDVGMLGASYVGWVQWFCARSGNPHLKCIAPEVSPPDPHENIPYEGGCFLLTTGWWARVLDDMAGKTEGKPDWKKAFATLPMGDLDDSLEAGKTFLDEWLAHPPHDRAYWEPRSYQHLFEKLDLPVFNITGWYDGDQPGALMNFHGMRQRAKTERARKSQFLVVGPWTHAFNTSRSIGSVDFGDEAVVDLDSRTLRFFDRYLKGVANGIEDEDPVLVFTMGTNRWHQEKDWPLPQTRWTKLFLRSTTGKTHQRDGDGELGLSPAGSGSDPSSTFTYDPHDLPDPGINFDDLSGARVMEDMSGEPDHKDELDFTSPPLAGPVELLGPVSIVLHVNSTAKDTDFTAALYRVDASGKMFFIRGGIQRLRYHQDPAKDTPVPPGTTVPVTIDCWATGIRLERGERIRVEVGSRGWPGYARNLNTLESPLTAKKGVVATNTVFHDKGRASYVLLPVVPREDAPGLSFEKSK